METIIGKATGRFYTRCGVILNVQTTVTLQDEMDDLDEKFSTVLQDEDVQKFLMKEMIELGFK